MVSTIDKKIDDIAAEHLHILRKIIHDQAKYLNKLEKELRILKNKQVCC